MKLGENLSDLTIAKESNYLWPQSQIIATSQPSDLLLSRPDLMTAQAQYDAQSVCLQEAKSQTS
ncbi:MAG: hypothetical protein PHX13_10770 [Thiovulaceae bacterium]|nr:hypothetical protein [Sulfurimonadaceae bacterium]